MFRLIGQIEHVVQHEIGGPFLSEYEDEVVALFSSEAAARDYIESARLLHPVHQSYAGERRFHARSLLGRCCDAWVEGDDHDSLPIDPAF